MCAATPGARVSDGRRRVVMRLHREVKGTLGEPVERGLPVIPERWKLPALIVVSAACIAILVLAIVYGLAHG
jgi:hypothetical protein